MKMWKRIFTAVLFLGIFLAPSFDSCAAETEPYKYDVTFYSGVQGTFADGSDKMVQADVEGGSRLFFNAQSAVTLPENSKYYVKGVRLAGRDNAEAEMAALAVDVNKDADYVVVYGIKGEQVKYTVHYQNEWGIELAPSDEFYGNVGDKPVVAYKYIAGFVPVTEAFTKTLSANEAENVITFVYKSAASGTTIIDGGTTIIYKDKIITVVEGGTGGEESAEGGSGAGTGESVSEETEEIPGGQQEIVDLDDEESPLGNIDLEGEDEGNSRTMLSMVTLVGLSLAALIILLILVLRFKMRMKREEEE